MNKFLYSLIGLLLALVVGVPAQTATSVKSNTNQFIGPMLPTNRPPSFRRGPVSTSETRLPAGSIPAIPAKPATSTNQPAPLTSPVPTRSLPTRTSFPVAATNQPTPVPIAPATAMSSNAPAQQSSSSGPAVSTPPQVAAPMVSNAAPVTTGTFPPSPAQTTAPALVPSMQPSQAAPPTTITPSGAVPSPAPGTSMPAPGIVPSSRPEMPGAIQPSPQARALSSVPAAEVPEPRDIILNFPNNPLENVLKFYSDLTGRTILRPATLPGNQSITLISNEKLTRTEAIQALHTVLGMNGVTMLPDGERFVRAVPSATALQEGTPFSNVPSSQIPEAGQFVTQVVQVTNVLPSELVQTLTPFAKTPQGIVPIDSSQTLVLRDFAANVKRMLEVIAKVDIAPPSDYKFEVIPIKYGKVEEIYDVMGSVIGSSGGGTGAAGGARTTSASSSMRSRGSSVRRSSGTSRGGLQRPGQTGTAQQQQPGQQSSFQQRLAQIVNRAATGDAQILEDARIIPDGRANSLVVYANKHDMDIITNIVAKLDIMLAQVLIESAIVDVSLNKNTRFGVSFAQNPKTAGDWTGTGGINNSPYGFLNSVSNFPGSLSGGFNYFANYRGDLEMAIQAISGKGSVTVLQKPRIQTTHAVPASFFNGQTVPYITGSYYGGVSGYGNSSQYQQLEVGIGLEVTPFITPDGLVLMEVNQTIDEISGKVKIDNNDVPTTTSRTASSTVSVRDGETIILGGHIRSSKSRTRSGVPGIMNIPLIGALFRSNDYESQRSELVVLLRPTVLRTPEDAAKAVIAEKENLPGTRLAEREYKDQEEAVRKAAEEALRSKDRQEKKRSSSKRSNSN